MKIITTILLFFFIIAPFSASALIYSGVGETKEEAIAEAKINAIQSSLSPFISSVEYKKKYGSLSKNLYANLESYLGDYELLMEEKKGNKVRVTIDIKLKTDKLKKFLLEKEGWIADEESSRLALFLKKTSRSHLSGRTREARYAYSEFKGILESEFGYEVIRNSLIEWETGSSRSNRRSRTRVKTMELEDAIEMAADMSANFAVLFDLKIDKKRERQTQLVTCRMTLSVYDTETGQKIDSYEIEGDAEQEKTRRGRPEERGDVVLDAIQSVVDQAALKVGSFTSKSLSGSERVRKYDLVFKNFKNDEIQNLVKEFKAMERLSRLKQIEQTARTYQAEILIAMNRNDFLQAVKNILKNSNFKYNLNFNRNKIYISKFRIKDQEEEEKTGYVDL